MALQDTVAGYVAFNAGNLMAIAQMMRARHPDMHILIAADDDHLLATRMQTWAAKHIKLTCTIEIDGVERTLTATDGTMVKVLADWRKDARGVPFIDIDARAGRAMKQTTFVNTGVAKATEAARAVGNASIVVPRFAQRGDNKWSDFNDLHVNESLDEVAAQLQAAIFAALNPGADDGDVAGAGAMLPDGPRELLVPEADNVIPLAGRKKAAAAATSAGAAAGGGGPPDLPGDGAGAPAGDEDEWKFRLSRSEKGNVLPTLSNVYLILENHDNWKGVIAYDEFSGQVVKLKLPPFVGAECGEWSDKDDLRCTLWMQQQFGFAPRQDVVMGAVVLAADLCKYHVVRAYLGALVWDGVARLDGWLVSRLGAEDTLYNRTVARKWLIAAVARIYRPGCKADNVLILEGEQGIFKSTALKVLGGDWFTDAPFRLGDKDAYVVIRGKWLVELAELDSFNKAESTGAKLFFGQYVDRYRDFYGKRASDVPRQQLFAGTTNSDAYLKDDTGNRRYWPVKVTTVDLAGLTEDRDQIWAEAVARFQAGEEWWPTSAEKEMFEEEQDERYVGDAYITEIRDYLVGKNQCTMPEILREALKLDLAKWTRPEQQRVGRCMAEMKWHRRRGPKGPAGKRDWVYVRPAAELEAAMKEIDDGPL
ncbi:virulence-associated E family protein [Rugamonas sp. DEMB1]|uniref:virulence-associated E family protein n=1 Tax=Rugamonas sp. DEMB1 TaxID=3039386 RepID=UPI002447BE59|nr:virulence-associated E family protein [Rugamonas sp. DEMB1]WGG51814.1 VapE family protein [Rugamonas sp. DEMB1]